MLALNLASNLVQSLALLVILMTIAGVLLFIWLRMTHACCSVTVPEGLQATKYLRNSWAVVIVTFVLTVIYLPLSTMAVHVLVWSDDLWAVPNPYTGTTTDLTPEPLGPSDEFRDPLDFCYTTTMLRNEVNWAPVIVILAIASFVGVGFLLLPPVYSFIDDNQLTVWFPIQLYTALRRVTPKVDRFTELGAPRSNSDMDREYQRLLGRDRNPLNFLYGGAWHL